MWGRGEGIKLKMEVQNGILVEQISVQLSLRKLIMVIQLGEGSQKEWSYSGREISWRVYSSIQKHNNMGGG